MDFKETKLSGAYIIDPVRLSDDRGFFARAWCRKEFEEQGLCSDFVQCNLSFNKKKGTLRGMHYQREPFAEVKIVRCTKGAVLDVIIDLRPESPTYLSWIGVELTEENHRMLYVPETFAHGYLTLTDNAEVFYQVSQFYTPDAEGGVRYNDPVFGIHWPETDQLEISKKDAAWPDYEPANP